MIGAARALRCGAGSAVRCRICGAVQDLGCGILDALIGPLPRRQAAVGLCTVPHPLGAAWRSRTLIHASRRRLLLMRKWPTHQLCLEVTRSRILTVTARSVCPTRGQTSHAVQVERVVHVCRPREDWSLSRSAASPFGVHAMHSKLLAGFVKRT